MRGRPELAQAYRAAWYEVTLPEGTPCRFRVGDRVHALEPLAGCGGWGWLTAFNPGSHLLPTAENARRHDGLCRIVASLGLSVLEASSGDDAGLWPVERGFCLLDVDRCRLQSLANDWQQAAFLHARPQEPVQLCWSDEPCPPGP
ncbi:MAG: DUF3293 domain-containing protein [Halothiobacillaceae bacterium]